MASAFFVSELCSIMKHSFYVSEYIIMQALIYKIYSFTVGVNCIGRESYYNV